ncbi:MULTISPECIES: ABC transporter permease [Mesorhizobium]|uniref:Putative spermidine/putrescine transport system permease protein n=1 Tax=Rhizobium loti TaxID=381 RepID=A0A8E2WGZ9_RHILI|nr:MULTISPECIES: ABC transporter permease [Mesorhizobium]PWJ93797.1 putative spermidine/putrescine transport system permease protein [Mesorhizobium loti]QKC82168.1 ABC transporter permease [Mesorhizobium sp. NZP2077]QKD15640.1 ABC transporter permease [Mesorhizobium sp. NZP2077]
MTLPYGDVGLMMTQNDTPAAKAAAPSVRVVRSSIRSDSHRRAVRAALPAAPLLIFLLVFLVIPIGSIVHTAVSDGEIARALPLTTQALQAWDGDDVPLSAVYMTFGQELEAAGHAGSVRPLSRRVGYELSRGANIILGAQRILSEDFDRADPQAWKAQLIKADPAWGQSGVWSIFKHYNGRYSAFYLRWATGFPVKIEADGRLSQETSYDFRSIYLRTILISLVVTGLTILIGYPVAYVIANASGRTAAVLLFFILLPFWTSLLVRTMSWIVFLQTNGVLNATLAGTGLISEPLPLLYTRLATIIAMIQIQLPFTVLPMISVMRAIPTNQVKAARNLGAGPLRAHATIFLPQAVPGIAAGGLLTFVLCLGFYLTPALVGGPSDQMVSFFIARFTNEDLNWGLASALSVILILGAGLVALPLARHVARHSSDRI